MVVLDADSFMAPATLVALAAAMESEPRLGILQTVPVLAGRHGLFPRLQQFAGRIYGPVVARGVAAWQGDDGNYWGHNAIIRVAAFAEACGLPDLPGHKPFGGPVMSHDFVEAALMRRAGWGVRLAPELGGSWEGAPPTLLDAMQRDRRWAQGNIQHLALLATRRLAWPSRVHFLTGVFSYLSSPLWLLMLVVGIVLTVQTHFAIPRYFTDTFQLFPTWPRFDSERMQMLFASTMAVLLLPKLIGTVAAVLNGPLRRGVGGALPLLGGVVVELFLSALYAPVMMLMQSRQVVEILLRRDAGWTTQNRDGRRNSFREVWRRHAGHVFVGVAVGLGVWWLAPGVFWWLAPTLAGLALAVPLSWMSGSVAIGRALGRARLLTIPEEREVPSVMRRQQMLVKSYEAPIDGDGLRRLATDPAARADHFSAVSPPRPARGNPDAACLTAAAKIADADTLDEALGWFDDAERMAVAGNAALVHVLSLLAGQPRLTSGDVADIEPSRRAASG
jgi:membrane glycosyltransferase